MKLYRCSKDVLRWGEHSCEVSHRDGIMALKT